ncbi:MAG: response regulator transcription factor [Chloroflexota bacterium]|nr:response regulator transcription factor [Chloroflexota bacterium]
MPLPSARILIAEDEAPLRNLVRMSLEAAGHYVTAVGDGDEALSCFLSEPYDLVILDVMMPKVDGFTVCEEIRKRSDVPVMMLTALGGTDDLVRGFELGADDYIAKPFTFKEVQARIFAILRRMQWVEEKRSPVLLAIGQVSIDADAHEVTVDGEQVHLTPIEFKLLYTLMSNAGKALNKKDLFVTVWGYQFIGGTNLIEVTIRRLREKIEEDPSKPHHIQTIRGTGYRFRSPD